MKTITMDYYEYQEEVEDLTRTREKLNQLYDDILKVTGKPAAELQIMAEKMRESENLAKLREGFMRGKI